MGEQILVLGAGGFIGRHLVDTLVQRGERIIAVSRRPMEFQATNVDLIVGELHEPEDFAPLVARSRTIFHVASMSTPGSTAGHPLVDLQENLYPTLALLQASQSYPDTRLIYVSSAGTLYAATQDEPAQEGAMIRPRAYHGAGKAAAEHFIGAWCSQFSTAALILRPSNIYGPGQTERAGFGIVPTALGKILRSEALTVWGDGSVVRDYLYIDDFIRLCLAVLDAPMPMGMRVVNAASGRGISLNALFTTMESVTGRQLLRVHDVRRLVDAAHIVVDPSLARDLYGWSPITSLPEGLKKTWDWLSTVQR